MSLARLTPEVDRTSDVIHKVHFVHLGGFFHMIVGGSAEPFLCDDHYDTQKWFSREDRSSRQITSRY
ncbi:hypothetical protein GJ744_011455 [Endocarpon pusillum]|uniref:Uncharacterized protein n=1 Tax=Endocarpon pusillum TaxID=364733 RepID=A0A8H7AGL5_9EURO|nr:hypothetical protein GJ744_011455 [Endocarpon pusillum]